MAKRRRRKGGKKPSSKTLIGDLSKAVSAIKRAKTQIKRK